MGRAQVGIKMSFLTMKKMFKTYLRERVKTNRKSIRQEGNWELES